ncbi:MBL fold metallo-hydrolase [bacterium]|nr:MBL fold metallo-hydrolase [bacterium]
MANYYMETFPVGMLQCNCTIIVQEGSKAALVVDPGDEAQLISKKLQSLGVGVHTIWHTHAHLDHVGATKKLYELFVEGNKAYDLAPPKIYLHKEDLWLYDNVSLQAQFLGMNSFEVPQLTGWIKDGQTYEGFDGVESIVTPGHTPGSCCLCVNGQSDISAPKSYSVGKWEKIPQILLTGDTLFRRGIGRTDLWGGDSQKIEKSIKNKLYKKSPEAVVIPGHGPLTIIEQEIEKNPFVRG